MRRGAPFRHGVYRRDPLALLGDGHYGNVKDFMMAVHENRQPQLSAIEARRAVNLLNRIYAKAGVGPWA